MGSALASAALAATLLLACAGAAGAAPAPAESCYDNCYYPDDQCEQCYTYCVCSTCSACEAYCTCPDGPCPSCTDGSCDCGSPAPSPPPSPPSPPASPPPPTSPPPPPSPPAAACDEAACAAGDFNIWLCMSLFDQGCEYDWYTYGCSCSSPATAPSPPSGPSPPSPPPPSPPPAREASSPPPPTDGGGDSTTVQWGWNCFSEACQVPDFTAGVPDGTVVTFDWTAGGSPQPHNLWRADDVEAYNTCDDSRATQIAPMPQGSASIVLEGGVDGTTYYLFCQVSGHCGGGMKVAIKVLPSEPTGPSCSSDSSFCDSLPGSDCVSAAQYGCVITGAGPSAACKCAPSTADDECDASFCSLYNGHGARCNSDDFAGRYGCQFDSVSRRCTCPPPFCDASICSEYNGRGARCKSMRYGARFGCEWAKATKTCACPP